MSSEAIITVENLGKRYRLGASRSNERYTALRDVVAEVAAKPFRALSGKVGKWKGGNGSSTSDLGSPTSGPASQEFWALKDVSFEVRRGEEPLSPPQWLSTLNENLSTDQRSS